MIAGRIVNRVTRGKGITARVIFARNDHLDRLHVATVTKIQTMIRIAPDARMSKYVLKSWNANGLLQRSRSR